MILYFSFDYGCFFVFEVWRLRGQGEVGERSGKGRGEVGERSGSDLGAYFHICF